MRLLIEPGAELEKVASGATWSEGPVWLPDSATVRFSDIPNNRILEFHEQSGELTVYRDEAGFTNGRTLDLQRRLRAGVRPGRTAHGAVAGTGDGQQPVFRRPGRPNRLHHREHQPLPRSDHGAGRRRGAARAPCRGATPLALSAVAEGAINSYPELKLGCAI
jgi:hypothetical protein